MKSKKFYLSNLWRDLGYMIEKKQYMEIEDVQNVMFEILQDIIQFCNLNEYHYLLTGGSALGAVRHHGFIPWDDDADIALPRDEYEQFIKNYTPRIPTARLFTLDNTENWFYPYARVSDLESNADSKWAKVNNGVYVDVFPIDALPKNKLRQSISYYRMKYLDVMRNSSRRIAISKQEKLHHLKPLFILFAKRHSTSWWAEKMNKLAIKTNLNYAMKSNMRSLYVVQGINGTRENFLISMYTSRSKTFFRSIDVYIPTFYQKYLTNLYGNWEQIPKKIDRKSHAKFYRKIRK